MFDRKTTAKECSTSFDRAGYSQVKQWTPSTSVITLSFTHSGIFRQSGVHCLTWL